MELSLVWLLSAAWVAGILPIVVASLPCSSLGSFHRAVSGFAKRGKIMQSSPNNKFTVPQKFFSHFYVVAVVWTTFLLVLTWAYAYKTAPLVSQPYFYSKISTYLAGSSNIFSLQGSHLISTEHRYRVWLSVFLLLLMEAQVLRRLLETIYVFNYSPSARMHIFAYLTGLYTCALEVFKFGTDKVTEFIVKGKSEMQTTEFEWWDLVNPLLKLGWLQWIGAAIFFWGWIHQHQCHAILGSIRERKEDLNEYVIPQGDWFDFVSSPHYLAEIVIYTGLLFASGGGDLTVWLLFIFVVTNLTFAAAETHRWYLHKFDNYPIDRFAIIPFIY